MKKLLITLMLVSPFSFADWGDVYYCQMITNSKTTMEGERTDYKLERFQFKLDKTKNAMVFGKGGYFDDAVMVLREKFTWASQEVWLADGSFVMLYFFEGRILNTTLNEESNTFISADCDKF